MVSRKQIRKSRDRRRQRHLQVVYEGLPDDCTQQVEPYVDPDKGVSTYGGKSGSTRLDCEGALGQCGCDDQDS